MNIVRRRGGHFVGHSPRSIVGRYPCSPIRLDGWQPAEEELKKRFRPARIAALMLACTAAIATSPAMAQAEPEKNSDIVVKGRTEELRYMLKDMLNESASSKQIGRFEQRLCPKGVGFPADWSKMLEDMVRKNATTGGLKLQKEGCKPNAMIIFIDEPQRLVSEMGKALPEFFGHMTEEPTHCPLRGLSPRL
ncbi:hypothetical protein [uncultured Sphingorhabdus sp.]|uniref:hypothetical protein n=1 Tax=uncultured Sphingorhabdus sp. TaxID=1686106 RepID=UPI002619130D|nr:hypothetical protein [uncultured Sphingorhabdus sp.]HMS20330.1 hypothetical protein [Sphingorhabdus sp.]